MRQATSKRRKRLLLYSALKKEIGRNNRYNMKCFFCNEKINIPIDCENATEFFDLHHIYGEKENEHLINPEEVATVHRKCHEEYHNYPIHKIKWWNAYIFRLAHNNARLYEKEIRRMNK
jgi:hypothetical protein